MKTKRIAMLIASALFTAGLAPLASAQIATGSTLDASDATTLAETRPMPEGIEVITVVGKHAMPEGIEVITVVGKRPMPEGIEVVSVVGKRSAPTLASNCVNTVLASSVRGERTPGDEANALTLEAQHANRNSVRAAIKSCIEQAQVASGQS